jgi:hypothetical protein
MKLNRFSQLVRPLLALVAVAAYFTMSSPVEAGTGCAVSSTLVFKQSGGTSCRCNSIYWGSGWYCVSNPFGSNCGWGSGCTVLF